MTEEEKKAIKYLKNEIERVNKENDFKKISRAIVCLPLFIDYAETLLNLIEKLQKENELRRKDCIELHKIANDRRVEIMELEENSLTIKQVQENFIPKDKIKEIIIEELPDDDICKSCGRYDVNGVVIKQKLIKVLEEEK